MYVTVKSIPDVFMYNVLQSSAMRAWLVLVIGQLMDNIEESCTYMVSPQEYSCCFVLYESAQAN